MSNHNNLPDFMIDGLRIFLDYVLRKSTQNPEYKPHPMIRALECALDKIDDLNEDETAMGVSSDGTGDSILEPYIVVIKKKNDGYEILEICNVTLNKELPVEVMITIFRLQIFLDKIESDLITPMQFVDALNYVIPGNNFFAIGDRWKEARDRFRELLKRGRIDVPNIPELTDELPRIKESTPWGEYSSKLRSFIGVTIAPELTGKEKAVIVSSPPDALIEKPKVFQQATDYLIGNASKYFKSE